MIERDHTLPGPVPPSTRVPAHGWWVPDRCGTDHADWYDDSDPWAGVDDGDTDDV